MRDRDAKIESLSAELSEREENAESLKQEMRDRDAKIESLSAELSEREENAESLKQEMRDRKDEIEKLSQEIVSLLDQVALGKQSTHHWWREYDKLRVELNKKQGILNAVYESRSWRITAPFRRLKTVVDICLRYIKIRLKMALHAVVVYVYRYPQLRSMVLRIINKIPRLKHRLIGIVGQAPFHFNRVNVIPRKVEKEPNMQQLIIDANIAHENNMIPDKQHLPPHARRFYRALKTDLMHSCMEKD